MRKWDIAAKKNGESNTAHEDLSITSFNKFQVVRSCTENEQTCLTLEKLYKILPDGVWCDLEDRGLCPSNQVRINILLFRTDRDEYGTDNGCSRTSQGHLHASDLLLTEDTQGVEDVQEEDDPEYSTAEMESNTRFPALEENEGDDYDARTPQSQTLKS